jgi:ATPase subunit of ABC transporter with duplicated ATPase domains
MWSLRMGPKMKIAASSFCIYAFAALKEVRAPNCVQQNRLYRRAELGELIRSVREAGQPDKMRKVEMTMLELKLREEFRGKRLKGTTVDFKNQSGTGALDVTAADFLKITYPSHDLLKTIEATSPGHSRPVVLLGARGQGKSHLMAALYHLCHDPDAGSAWLSEWESHLKNSQIAEFKLRNDCFVIAESLHLQRYKYLWDILFQLHPKGQWYVASVVAPKNWTVQ